MITLIHSGKIKWCGVIQEVQMVLWALAVSDRAVRATNVWK